MFYHYYLNIYELFRCCISWSICIETDIMIKCACKHYFRYFRYILYFFCNVGLFCTKYYVLTYALEFKYNNQDHPELLAFTELIYFELILLILQLLLINWKCSYIYITCIAFTHVLCWPIIWIQISLRSMFYI